MVEAAELMERFQWHDEKRVEELLKDGTFRESVEDEMADVLAFLLALSNRIGVDLAGSFERKMVKNELKYPVEKFYGRYEHLRGTSGASTSDTGEGGGQPLK
jgi:NTP pyrophosphatase (non-canonical NTP hydrolase)